MTISANDHGMVVGGQGSLEGSPPFDWARPVLQTTDTYLVVHGYSLKGDPEGDPLDEGEFRTLVEEEDIFLLAKPAVAKPHGVIWLFRPQFRALLPEANPEKDLSGSAFGPLDVHTTLTETQVFLVEEPAANSVRAHWRAETFAAARKLGRKYKWREAKDYAKLAFDLAPTFDVVDLSLLLLVLDEGGETELAARYLAMAERSRGAVFSACALSLREVLRADISTARLPADAIAGWAAFVSGSLTDQLDEIARRQRESNASAIVLFDALLSLESLNRQSAAVLAGNILIRNLDEAALQWGGERRWPELTRKIKELTWAASPLRQPVGDLVLQVSRALDEQTPQIETRDEAVDTLDKLSTRCRKQGDDLRHVNRSGANRFYEMGAKCIEIIADGLKGGKWSLYDQAKWLIFKDCQHNLEKLPPAMPQRVVEWGKEVFQTDFAPEAMRGRLQAIQVLHRAARATRSLVEDDVATRWTQRAVELGRNLLHEESSPSRIMLREPARAVKAAAVMGLPPDKWEDLVGEIMSKMPPNQERLRSAVNQDLAWAWLASGMPAKAEPPAREAMKLSPGDPPAAVVLAEALRVQGNVSEAADVLRQASVEARQLGKPPGLCDWIEWRAAALLDEEGLVREAIRAYLDILAKTQPNNLAVAMRAEELLRGEFSARDAREMLQPYVAALQIPSPAQAGLMHSFEISYSRSSPSAELEAQVLYERARRLNSDSPEFQQALVTHRVLAQSETADAVTRTRLGFLEARGGDIEQAKGIAQSLPGDDSFRFSLMGLVHAVERDFEKAVDAYHEAWTRSRNPALLDQVAWLLLRHGGVEKACGLLTKLVADHPNDTIGWMHLGVALLTQGNKTEAARALLKSFLLDAHAALEMDFEIDVDTPHSGGATFRRRTAHLLGALSARHPETISLVLDAAITDAPGPVFVAELIDGLAVGRAFEREVLDRLLVFASTQPLVVKRRLAQYAMAGAIEIEAGVRPGVSRQWLDSAVNTLSDTVVWAELLAGAKGWYARTVRRLVGLRASRSEVAPPDPGLCPMAFQDLFEHIATTRGSPDYYAEAERRLAGIHPVGAQVVDYAVFQVRALLQRTWQRVATLDAWDALAELPAAPGYGAISQLAEDLHLTSRESHLPWLWTDRPTAEVALDTLKEEGQCPARLTCAATENGVVLRIGDGKTGEVWKGPAIRALHLLGWTPLSPSGEGSGFQVPAIAAFQRPTGT